MVVLALIIGLWSWRVHKVFPDTAGTSGKAGQGWRHGLGCIAVWIVVVPAVAFVPMLALLPCAVFVVLAARSFGRSSPARRNIASIILLCALVWLAYFVYETQLLAWMATVRAPIRADFMVTAPLLYYVSVVGLSFAGGRPKPDGVAHPPAGADEPGDASARRPSAP
jgi:hypothetical protein